MSIKENTSLLVSLGAVAIVAYSCGKSEFTFRTEQRHVFEQPTEIDVTNDRYMTVSKRYPSEVAELRARVKDLEGKLEENNASNNKYPEVLVMEQDSKSDHDGVWEVAAALINAWDRHNHCHHPHRRCHHAVPIRRCPRDAHLICY